MQGLGALVVLTGAAIGASVTLRQVRTTRDQIAETAKAGQDQLELSRGQLQLSEQGQVTDRYTKAIDQLDYHKALAVRLGGLYALERIAHDSPANRATIAEVLCAYARTAPGTRTPAPAENANPPRWPRPPGPAERPSVVLSLTVRAPDVQAAVTILGRWQDRLGEPPPVLDLHNADLRGARLDGAQLQNANLAGAQLQDAVLNDAQLQGAMLRGAQLQRARLNGGGMPVRPGAGDNRVVIKPRELQAPRNGPCSASRRLGRIRLKSLSARSRWGGAMPDQGERRFQLFLSHSHRDADLVVAMAEQLDRLGVSCWLDQWEMIPGESSVKGLAKGLAASDTVAVIVAKHGIGRWQDEEALQALRQSIENGKRVFYVWMPGSDPAAADLEDWLGERTYVDLRRKFRNGQVARNGLIGLVSGALGIPPRAARAWLDERLPAEPDAGTSSTGQGRR